MTLAYRQFIKKLHASERLKVRLGFYGWYSFFKSNYIQVLMSSAAVLKVFRSKDIQTDHFCEGN